MYIDENLPHEVKLNPKENYFRMVSGEEPEWLPTFMNNGNVLWNEEFLTPMLAPEPVVTTLGVTYVGNPDLMNGAMPKPGEYVITDITKWRDQLHIKDITDTDFEQYYAEKMKGIDRETHFVTAGGADYFLTLVSLMGFEETMFAILDEPDEVKALLDHTHEFYMYVFDKQLQYVKPEMISTMDDICSWNAPFFGLDVYREFFKPLEKAHYDKAIDHGMYVAHHCCGKCEIFIEDWIELGVQVWNPAQTCNDLVGIKEKYPITIEGGWDEAGWENCDDEEKIRTAVKEYIDTFAPGGRFNFFATCGGNPLVDPKAKWRNDIVQDVYVKYGFDFYKN